MKRLYLISASLAFVSLACGGTIEGTGGVSQQQGAIIDDTEYFIGGDYIPPLGEIPPDVVSGGCWITGGGHIGTDENGNGISDKPGAGVAYQDSFGGNAKGFKDGTVKGQWQNTTHLEAKDKFHGQATFHYCWHDGGPGPDVPKAEANRAIWGGPGTWDHEPGYLFIVSAADYKEGKEKGDADIRDAYAITIYHDDDGDGVATAADSIVYQETDCWFGNFQIHPPNNGHPYIPAELSPEMDRVSSEQELCPNANW
jgi:hypothetical protein